MVEAKHLIALEIILLFTRAIRLHDCCNPVLTWLLYYEQIHFFPPAPSTEKSLGEADPGGFAFRAVSI